MVYNYDYTDTITRCSMIASYEGRDYTGDSGDSLYLTVKITNQDLPLIKRYLEEAARLIEDGVARMVDASSYSDSGFSWTLRTEDTRWNTNKKLDENLKDALVSYAMMQWLAERKPARVDMYKELWENMRIMAMKNIFRKMPPKLTED